MQVQTIIAGTSQIANGIVICSDCLLRAKTVEERSRCGRGLYWLLVLVGALGALSLLAPRAVLALAIVFLIGCVLASICLPSLTSYRTRVILFVGGGVGMVFCGIGISTLRNQERYAQMQPQSAEQMAYIRGLMKKKQWCAAKRRFASVKSDMMRWAPNPNGLLDALEQEISLAYDGAYGQNASQLVELISTLCGRFGEVAGDIQKFQGFSYSDGRLRFALVASAMPSEQAFGCQSTRIGMAPCSSGDPFVDEIGQVVEVAFAALPALEMLELEVVYGKSVSELTRFHTYVIDRSILPELSRNYSALKKRGP